MRFSNVPNFHVFLRLFPHSCLDSDYRGEIMVLLFNHSDVDYTINAGDRCAQIIIEPVVYPVVQEVKELDETVRGFGGFGSTGY